MNSSQQSTQYTAMYNTFKTYIHGKDIDNSYNLDYAKEKEKEKSKTTQQFHTNESNKYRENSIKPDNNFSNSNYLSNSYGSNNINDNIKKYEIIRNGPMYKITEDERENEETFHNEEPKFYDEYDEQYVKYLFIFFNYIFREILFVGIAKQLLLEEKLGKK